MGLKISIIKIKKNGSFSFFLMRCEFDARILNESLILYMRILILLDTVMVCRRNC